ncbi:MAG: hypothetical protein Tsb0034_10540 [Ekhidna sp.]
MSTTALTAQKYPFKPGERLVYKMNFGWFNVGEAEMWLDPELHYQNSKPHYNLQFHAKTASWFKVFSKLEICMESLIQADNLQPYKSHRDLEGKNRIDIRHDFFKYGDSIKVNAYIEDIDQWRYHTFPNGNVPIRDALSTYLWLRSKRGRELEKPIELRTFFTNDLYEFSMRPKGRTTYKYGGDKIAAREFELVFPEGEYFDKGKTGKVILTDDERMLPLKLEIDMSVGSFKFQLESVEYE